MIQTRDSSILLFTKAVEAHGTFRGIAALGCGHTTTYRTNNPKFVRQIEHSGWFLPCPKCDRGTA